LEPFLESPRRIATDTQARKNRLCCSASPDIRSAGNAEKVTFIRAQRSAIINPQLPISNQKSSIKNLSFSCSQSSVLASLSKCALHLGRGRRRGIRFSFRFQETKLVPKGISYPAGMAFLENPPRRGMIVHSSHLQLSTIWSNIDYNCHNIFLPENVSIGYTTSIKQC